MNSNLLYDLKIRLGTIRKFQTDLTVVGFSMISRNDFIATAFFFGHKLTLLHNDGSFSKALLEKNQVLRNLLDGEDCPLDEMKILAERNLLEDTQLENQLTIAACLSLIAKLIGNIKPSHARKVLDISETLLEGISSIDEKRPGTFSTIKERTRLRETLSHGVRRRLKEEADAPQSDEGTKPSDTSFDDPFTETTVIPGHLRTRPRPPRVYIPAEYPDDLLYREKAPARGRSTPKAARPPPFDEPSAFPESVAAPAADPQPPRGASRRRSMPAKPASSPFRPGRAFFNPPKTMWVGISELIELRVRAHHVLADEEIAAIKNTMRGDGDTRDEIIPRIGARMAAQLFSDDEYVTIMEMSTREQDLTLKGITHWDWSVRPLKSGDITLILRLTLKRDLRGQPLETDLEALRSEIRIRVKSMWAYPAKFWRKHWQWAVGTLLGVPTLIGSVLALL